MSTSISDTRKSANQCHRDAVEKEYGFIWVQILDKKKYKVKHDQQRDKPITDGDIEWRAEGKEER